MLGTEAVRSWGEVFAKITAVTAMFPKFLGSTGKPSRMLIAGLIGAVLVVSINSAAQYGKYQAIAAENREFVRRTLAYDRCAADVRKSGKFGDLLDVGIEAMCPAKPSRAAIDFLTGEVRSSRATALWLAGIVVALGSLPWLASRWRRARVTRPPIRA
jgi:hypothetical protein